MSGFAIGYGNAGRKEIEAMLKKIEHRGKYLSGIYENGHIVMGQNYLQSDGVPARGQSVVPLKTSSAGDIRICYDGQIGNGGKLARSNGLSDGPFLEERLLLSLYPQRGYEMLSLLNDAIFAFVISDGKELFAARDILGIKTLFYGRKEKTLYLASELKSILQVTDDVHEFPPGHYMDSQGNLIRFAELPKAQPKLLEQNVDAIARNIKAMIRNSVRNRVDFRSPTGSLLSGGIDSSVITCLATEIYREEFGEDARLKTFALGVGESEDIHNARVVARYLNSDHHELIVDMDLILSVLSDVIYYLESFDPSLVRSSVSNFLVSRYARDQGIQVLLSGEGGDELFCGYSYLKNFPLKELFSRQMECLGFLHNNASLRLDRMNQCHGVRVVAPLISGELLQYAMAIPPQYKQKPEGGKKVEKWIFRKAFESMLPHNVVWRIKQEFSEGSGSASLLQDYLENAVEDEQLAEAQLVNPIIRSKEELFYFRIFTKHFGVDKAVKTVGQWIRL